MSVVGISPEKHAALEPVLAELAPGHQLTVHGPAGDVAHRILIMVTDKDGIHTGRRRFLVACTTCEVLVHEATTGPLHQADFHLRESKERADRRAELAKRFA